MSDAKMRIVIGAEAQEALSAMNQVRETTKNTAAAVMSSGKQIETSATRAGKALADIKKPSNDATQSLINVSRVAQDLPYGFLGVANNLNPLLEGFQRLSASSKAAGTSIGKELVGALKGPAGVGVALSVVSSLLVVFGGDLTSMGGSANKAKAEVEQLSREVESLGEKIRDVGKQNDFKLQLGNLSNKILGFGKVEDLKQEVFLTRDALYDAGQNVVAARKQTSDMLSRMLENDNDDNKRLYEESQKNLSDAFKKEEDLRNKQNLLYRTIELQQIQDAKEAADRLKQIREQQKQQYESYVNETISKAKEYSNALKRTFVEVDLNVFQTRNEQFQIALKYLDDYKNGLLSIKKVEGSVELMPINSKEIDEATKRSNELQDAINRLFKSSSGLPSTKENPLSKMLSEIRREGENIADLVSGPFTSAFDGFFDALKEGEDPVRGAFEGIKNSIFGLIKELGQAAIKALVLRAILSAISPGGSAVPSFGSLFKNVLGVGGVSGLGDIGAGQMNLNVSGSSRISGGDIVIAFNQASGSFNRSF